MERKQPNREYEHRMDGETEARSIVIEKKLKQVNGDKLLELLAGLENRSERGAQAMLKSDDSV